MNAVTDFFRCPDAFVPLQGPGRLSEKPHSFFFGPEIRCYGRTENHAGGDLFPQVTASSSAIRLPFDLTQTIASFHYEKYPHRGHGSSGLLSTHLLEPLYYAIRPFLPAGWRRMLQRVYLSDWRRLPFPSWPVDFSADLLLERLLAIAIRAQHGRRVPFVWFWPEGASAAIMMTHDVETETGRDFISTLMDVDEHFGIKASYQLVPEDRYTVPLSLRQQIRARGCELAVHGLNHNGNLFAHHETFLKHCGRINHYIREFDAEGFRSPCMYRNADWLEALDIRFDMSIPTVAHLEPQRGGCCTVFPYFIGDIVELPLTTTQDYSLFHILGSYSLELWKEQSRLILDRQGLMSFITHPDYLIDGPAMNVYRSLLAYLTGLCHERKIWMALPSEVNRWWRQRREMTVVLRDGHWTVQGPGRERARLGFVSLEGDQLVYSLADQDEGGPGHQDRPA